MKKTIAAIIAVAFGFFIAPLIVFGYLYLESYIKKPAIQATQSFLGEKRTFERGDAWTYRGRTYVKRLCRLTVWNNWQKVGAINGIRKFVAQQGINSAGSGELPRWVDRPYIRRVPDLASGKWFAWTTLQYDCGVAKSYYLDTNRLVITIK